MKVYIRAVATIQKLRDEFGKDMDEDTFDALINVDPTARPQQGKGGKYSPWIFRQHKKGNLDLAQQAQTLYDALQTFSVGNRPYQYTDLNQYKSVRDFLDDDRRASSDDALTDRQRDRIAHRDAKQAAVSGDGIELVASDGDWEVYTPHTYSASIALAMVGVDTSKPYAYSYNSPKEVEDNMKATWCTAASNSWYNSYTADGPLYIFINRNDPINKYQSCPGAAMKGRQAWFFDKFDHELGREGFFGFMKEHPGIGDVFEIKTVGGVQMMAGSIIGFDNTATTIDIPEGATSVSQRFPSSAVEIRMPNTLVTLPVRAFDGLNALKSVTLSKQLAEIPDQAFRNCDSLETLMIPDSVTSYGESAFEGCTALKTLINSNSLLHIGNRCFADCSQLEDFEIPDSVTEIGNSAFSGVGFTEVTIPASMTKLDSTFRGDTTIQTVHLQNVTAIGAKAFKESSIANIDLSGVSKIGSGAFSQCSNLVSVHLSDGVHLMSSAFANNPNLAEINVPVGCELGFVVFNECPNLTVRWEAEDSPYEFDDIKLLVCDASCTQLINANKGFVRIKTFQGDTYEV